MWATRYKYYVSWGKSLYWTLSRTLNLHLILSAPRVEMSTPVSSPLPNKDDPKVGAKDVWVEDRDGDAPLDVMEVYRSYAPEYRRDIELKLRRKIDTRILPLVVIIYLFNYLDRNSITQARLYGLQEDTGVKGAQ